MDSLDSCDNASKDCFDQPFNTLESIKKKVDTVLAAGNDIILPLEKRPRNPAVLILWIEEHSLNPYPTKDEKRVLGHYAGMTQRQLNDWFANARRNIKKVGYPLWKEKHSAYSARFSVPVTQDSSSEAGSSADCASNEQEVAVVENAPPRALVKPLPTNMNAKKTNLCKKVPTHNHRGFQPYFLPAHLAVPHRGMTVRHLNTRPDFYQFQSINFGNRGPPAHPQGQPLQTMCYPPGLSTGHYNKPPLNTAVLQPPLWGNTSNMCTTSAPASLITPIIDSVVTTVVETTPVSSNELMGSTSANALIPESSWCQSNLPSTGNNDSRHFNEFSSPAPSPQEFTVAWATAANYPPSEPNKPTGTTANFPPTEAFH